MQAIVVFVVGAPNIGKSNLLANLTKQESCDIGPTLGIELRMWSYKHLEKTYRFRIWDVSGKSPFGKLVSTDIHLSNISILCYDTCDGQTLAEMRRWLTLVEQAPRKIHVVICGFIHDDKEREVMPAEIHSIVRHAKGRRNIASIQPIETRTNERIHIFQALVGIAVHGNKLAYKQ